MILGMLDLKNCLSNNNQYVSSLRRIINVNTIFVFFEALVFTGVGEDTTSEIVSNYLVIDIIKNRNF